MAGASSTTTLAGADPFIAVVPALAGIAAGIVAVRLLPVPMLVLSRLAAFRRDLVPVLALRRVTRGGTSGPVLIVLMATATIGTFAGATLVHLDRAAEAVAWEEIGAPYRADRRRRRCRATSIRRAGPASRSPPAQYGGVVGRPEPLPAAPVRRDRRAANYQQVIAGTGADGHLPPEMLGRAGAAAARDRLAAADDRRTVRSAIGGTFSLVVEGYARHVPGRRGPRLVPRHVPEPAVRRRLPRPAPGAPRRRRAPNVDRDVPPGAGRRRGRDPRGRSVTTPATPTLDEPRGADRLDRGLPR